MIEKMTDADYFALEAISNSKLSRLAKCPAAMDIEFETTPAMLLGSIVHCIVLEGKEVFHQRYAVAPLCDKRTNTGKAEWQKFTDEHWGLKVVTQDQFDAAVGMALSVAAHPACQDILKDGTPELAVTWCEEVNGETIPAKAKCDWLSDSCLIDLKSCQDSSYPIFSKTIYNNRYAQQFGFYRRGLAANGVFPEHHVIIAVESKAPFVVNCFELDSEVLDYGEGQSMELLKQYAQIKDMDVKPAYTYAGISTIRLPQWLRELE